MYKTEKRRGREREGKEVERRGGERREERKVMGKRDRERGVIEEYTQAKICLSLA